MRIEKNINLKEFTTFKIGGAAQFFCVVKNEGDIAEAVKFSKENKIPYFILGGGSDILIKDEGFPGLVIKMENMGIKFEENGGNARVTVEAGEEWDAFVEEVVNRGLYGIENLSLIPGTVGAAPVQNIGAYGSEIKDVLESVRVFDIGKNNFINLNNEECQFTYRDSIFKKKNSEFIIISVILNLKKKGEINIEYKDLKEYFAIKKIQKPTLKEVRDAVVDVRTKKLPDVKKIGTAGSFFKNPMVKPEEAEVLKKQYPGIPVYPFDEKYVKISAAWMIDNICGYRGISRGNVGTYQNQALVLVNNGGATAKEILDLAAEIQQCVKGKTGISLEPEVLVI